MLFNVTVLTEPRLDEQTLGELFESYYGVICNFCFRHTANWEQSEDLASAVFLEAWRKREKVSLTVDDAKPWLFGVALNMVRNQRRSQRRFLKVLAKVPKDSVEPDFSDRVVTGINAEQRVRVILSLFKRLPRKEQEVISLCDWSELSYEEAASVLRVPIGTIKSRLARGRQRLDQLASSNPALVELKAGGESGDVE